MIKIPTPNSVETLRHSRPQQLVFQGLAVVQISIRFHLILELVTENDAGNDVNMTHAFIQTVELFALVIIMSCLSYNYR